MLITEEKIRKIVGETVSDILGGLGLISEMAVPLEDYKARVDGLRFQLVINWCLCKWCQLYNPNSENFPHWITELKACIDNLKFLDIKKGISKKKTLIRMLVKDYDYDKSSMIERIIRSKFIKEKIINTKQKAEVCELFSKEVLSLIELISNNTLNIEDYLQETFGIKII